MVWSAGLAKFPALIWNIYKKFIAKFGDGPFQGSDIKNLCPPSVSVPSRDMWYLPVLPIA